MIRIRKEEQAVPATLADISEAGVCLILPCELWPEEMVKLKTADSTLFGHVVYSTWKRNAFRTGVEVERVLLGGTDLAGSCGSCCGTPCPVSRSRARPLSRKLVESGLLPSSRQPTCSAPELSLEN